MKAVIFDMDGVLINTEPLHYRCWKEILKEKNGIDLDYEAVSYTHLRAHETIMDRFLMMGIR